MSISLSDVMQQITRGTVLGDWYAPMVDALTKVRYSDKPFTTMPMSAFVLCGCLRQLQSTTSLREQVQQLFHLNTTAEKMPLARSTYSDALASRFRREILRDGVDQLVSHAQDVLPDRLSGLEGIGNRAVMAIDTTYQTESAHYRPIYPMEGGHDSQKGHGLSMIYDIRHGIPLAVNTETISIGEMRVLKRENEPVDHWMRVKNAIYVVDRAFIDGRYWDKRLTLFGSTVITRMKSVLNYTVSKERPLKSGQCNEGILYDREVELKCSKKAWRLIGFQHPDGKRYEYLTNDMELEPGVVAFLYLRRWDEEKYFDDIKNNLACSKAWGKNPVSIEQQALLSMVTMILTTLFINRRKEELGLDKIDSTQHRKQQAKKEFYAQTGHGIAYRVFYDEISKITRQIWRFLKNCYAEVHSVELYRRQLRPLMVKYL